MRSSASFSVARGQPTFIRIKPLPSFPNDAPSFNPTLASLTKNSTRRSWLSRQQKVFVFNVLEGDGMPSRGPNYRRKYEAVLNDDYLAKGWHVVDTKLSSEEESTYMVVVLERED